MRCMPDGLLKYIFSGLALHCLMCVGFALGRWYVKK